MLDRLIEKIASKKNTPMMIRAGKTFSYAELSSEIFRHENYFSSKDYRKTTIALIGDYSLDAIAALIALWRLGNTVALLTNRPKEQEAELIALSEASYSLNFESMPLKEIALGNNSGNDLLVRLTGSADPGFIIFSSGSTGTPKASVHRAIPLLEKHSTPKKRLRSISFLLFDHIGGLNTIFYILFNGGTLVIPESRRPEAVAKAITDHAVETLTTSPTFLRLLLLSSAIHKYDLSSLQVVNYGTEPMTPETLKALTSALPEVRFSQAYGLTETGVIPTQSKASNSNWVKLGDPDCDVRIVDGLLEVKARTSMLGYLGRESPFTADGYFRTGDRVVQDGEYVRILGRESEIINIGGEKIYPAEIESVLEGLDGVLDVAVSKAEHPLIGNIITARFHLKDQEPLEAFRQRLFAYCSGKLSAAQLPRKIHLTQEPLHGARFKKIRT